MMCNVVRYLIGVIRQRGKELGELLADKADSLGQTVAEPILFEANTHPVTHVVPEFLPYPFVDSLIAVDMKLMVGKHQQNHDAVAMAGSVKIKLIEQARRLGLDTDPAMSGQRHLDFAGGKLLGLFDCRRNLPRFCRGEEFAGICRPSHGSPACVSMQSGISSAGDFSFFYHVFDELSTQSAITQSAI